MQHRLATQNDLDAVYALYMAPTVVPFLAYDAMARSDFEPVYEELLSTHNFTLCLDDSGELAGFYRVTRFSGRMQHVAYLSTVAVAPRLAGTGVARSMIDAAIGRLRVASVLRFELLVESDNPRAIAFYTKLGFEVEGRQRMAYKRAHQAHFVDELMMALVFSGPLVRTPDPGI